MSAPALPVPHGTQGAAIDELRDRCGVLIGGTLEFIRQLTGRDLFLELLEPISGDFDAVSAMQQGWLHLAGAADEVEGGWRDLDAHLRPVWEGVAAESAGSRLAASAHRQHRQARACALIGDQLGHLVELAYATARTVCAVLEFLDARLQSLLLDLLAGGAGVIKDLVTLRRQVRQLLVLVDRATEAVQGLLRAVRVVNDTLAVVQATLAGASLAVAGGGMAGHAAAGGYLDDTARAGFGG